MFTTKSGFSMPGASDETTIGEADGVLIASVRKGTPVALSPYTFLDPVLPGNPLFDFDMSNSDGLGNSSSVRPIFVAATDNVTSGTHTWVFANAFFTQLDVGRILNVSGATNGANNAQFLITAVTNATTIVTTGTQVTETFSTPANLVVSVNGPGAGVLDGGLANVFWNQGAFILAGGGKTNAVRSAGNLIFRQNASAGRGSNLWSVHSDGTGLAASASFSALPATMMVVCVFSMDALAPSGGHLAMFDGTSGGRSGMYIDTGTGGVNLSGAGGFLTNLSVGSNQLNSLVAVYNGASTFANLNGVSTSGLGSPTPQGLTRFTLFSLDTNAFPMIGDIYRIAGWDTSIAGAPSVAQVQAAMAARYGVMPQ